MLVDKQHVSVRFGETKLKKRHEKLAVLYDIGSDLARSLSLTEILDRAILKVREHFKADAVRIYPMDETEECLELVAYEGIAEDQLEGLRQMGGIQGVSNALSS